MKIIEKEDYLELVLESGDVYKVDKQDRELVESYKWSKGYYGYLCTYSPKVIRFHKLITSCPENMVIDHINRDVTDNRRKNLRTTTQAVNARNQANTTGKFKGVSWSKHVQKWRVTLRFQGKQKHLGYFTDEVEAAKAYDRFILENLNGEGYLNFEECIKS